MSLKCSNVEVSALSYASDQEGMSGNANVTPHNIISAIGGDKWAVPSPAALAQ